MTESVIYALSHAAFGAIALAAMGYVVLLAGKLEERNLRAEADTQPNVVKGIKASGAADALGYVYVYGDEDAKKLSDQLHSMRRRLPFAYIGFLLLHSPNLRAFVGVEDLAVVRNAATLLELPEPLLAPFGFTVYVVVELWLRTRAYLNLLSRGR